MLPMKSTLFGWLQNYSQIFDLPMTNTLAYLHGVSVTNKTNLYHWHLKYFKTCFSSSLTPRTSKLECFSHGKPFQPSLIFVGKARGMLQKKLQPYSQILCLQMKNTLAYLYGVSVTNKQNLYLWYLQCFKTCFSSSLTLQTRKLECVSHGKIFQRSLIFVATARGLFTPRVEHSVW
jgi:hypothetical protein